jgi:V/A-type H+/Na+-transporting ATPase subunit C
MKNEDFAHLAARIRALEPKLLNANELERMLLAKSAKDAYKILNELDYASHVGDIDDVSGFQEVINAGLKDSKDLIAKIAPYRWVFDVLWFRYDFHNIKTLLKAKLSGKTVEEVEDFLMPFGAIDLEKLKTYIVMEENTEFGIEKDHEEMVKKAIAKAVTEFEKTEDPQMLDIFLDKKFCEITLYIAKKSKHSFVIDLVKKYIDLKNLEAVVRIKIAGKEVAFLEKVLVEGGNMETKRFLEIFGKELSEMPEFLKHSEYAKVIAEGIKGFEEEKSLSKLEKYSYDHLTDFIQLAKRIPFGPEPIIGYFWAKKNNALIIRTILVGKLNGFEPEEIKSKLRNLYSS